MKIALQIVGMLLLSITTWSSAFALSAILPISEVTDVDKDKATLGNMLFHDKKLSPNGTVSCSSCHDLKTGGVDRLTTSTGINNQKGPINAPTVYNSRYNFAQFWDGRAKDLKEQAMGPVTNPKEMGSNWPYVIKYVSLMPAYKAMFDKSYGGQITKDTIAEAIAEFEKTLVTPSAFDDFLKGNMTAISPQARKGYFLFISFGCTTCHNGRNVGGTIYMKLGLVNDYFKERGGEITEADLGRYNVTKNEADKHYFKVPTLRNIELTYPYFHDGSAKTLPDAVRTMGRYQLGRELSENDVADLVAFLKSLTGKKLKRN